MESETMSVEQAIERALQLDRSDYGRWRVDRGAVNALIAAIRAAKEKK